MWGVWAVFLWEANFFIQAEDGIRDKIVTGVQTCAFRSTNLYLLDIGYNELDSLPESFCDLSGLTYLWAFNNTLSSVPACICSLDIDWNDMDAAWYPYFAIGGNQLCDNEIGRASCRERV